MKTKLLSITALVACLLVSCSLAFAHAVLLTSTPAAHATVHGPSVDIDLKFNSRIDGSRSTLVMLAADGSEKPVTLGKQHESNQLVAHVQLPPGNYTLRWTALAVDGHITRGQIPFSVV